jgi:hypothetical protein
LYGDENVTSFFRRLTFSPDGNLLFTPAGWFEDNSVNVHSQTGAKDEDLVDIEREKEKGGRRRPKLPRAHAFTSIQRQTSPKVPSLHTLVINAQSFASSFPIFFTTYDQE